MKKAPQLIRVEELTKWDAFSSVPYPDNPKQKMWVKARPIGYFSLFSRLRLAWGVFTGKWDALEWEDGQ